MDTPTTLVTGASRGIGAAIADALEARGCRVLRHASQARDGMLGADLREPGAGARLLADALERLDGARLDALANNAGIYVPTPLHGDWRAAWEATMAVNLRAPAELGRAAIAHFRERSGTGHGGRILNIASRAAHRGDGPDHDAYAASKAGLLAMGKTWARALGPEGIEVYAIAPGWVDTDMARAEPMAAAEARAAIPLGELADPREIAAVAAMLICGGCPSATGAVWDINGASHLR